MKFLIYNLIILFLSLISLCSSMHSKDVINSAQPDFYRAYLNNHKKPYFIENKGQWDDSIKFVAQTKLMNIIITNNAIIFDKFNYVTDNESNQHFIQGKIIKLNVANHNPWKIIPQNIIHNKFNYIRYNKTISNVPIYSTIELSANNCLIKTFFSGDSLQVSFYPYTSQDNPEINFIGITNLLDFLEEFRLNTQILTLLPSPHNPIEYKVIINSNIENHILSNKEHLLLSTFIGGANFDILETMKIDNSSNIVVTGYTSSLNFPVTTGAYQKELKHKDIIAPDIFVAKFDSTLQNLIFSTYIGGELDDFCKSLDLDPNNYIYLTGYTNSIYTFPTTPNAFQQQIKGGYDAFVIKLDSLGRSLIYSTLIGGTKDDYSQAIVLDKNNTPLIVGYTLEAGNYPTTSNAYQTTNEGKYDVFLTKLIVGTNVDIEYSTLIGGNDNDFGQHLKIDNEGHIYVVGLTRSPNFPTTANAFDRTYNDTSQTSDRSDAFLSIFSSDCSQLLYSTYFGGILKDGAYFIELDEQNNIYITGITESPNFPVTPNAYDTTYNNRGIGKIPGDVFVTKFNYDKTLDFSTFIGGESTDKGYALALDPSKNIHLVGTTSSRDFPTTPNAYSKNYADLSNGPDVFYLILNNTGTELKYSTFIGGSLNDIGKAIQLKNDKYAYIAGTTSSPNFPVTSNSYDTTYNDTLCADGFITKMLIPFFEINLGSNIYICKGTSVKIGKKAVGGTGNLSYEWFPKEYLDNPYYYNPIATPPSTITYRVVVRDEQNQIATDSITCYVLPVPFPLIIGPKIAKRNYIYEYFAHPAEGGYYLWNIEGGEIISGQGEQKIKVKWSNNTLGKLKLIVKNKWGCKDSISNFLVDIDTIFKPVIVPNKHPILCDGDTIILNGTSTYLEYYWSNGKTTQYDTIIANINDNTFSYWLEVVDSSGLKRTTDTLTITVLPKPPKPEILRTNNTLFSSISAYKYEWYRNDSLTYVSYDNEFTPTREGTYKLIIYYENGCFNESNQYDFIYLSVTPFPEKNEKFNLYPNPNNGKFLITLCESPEWNPNAISIKIINSLGKNVDFDYFISKNNINIELKEKTSNIYFLILKYNFINYFYKILVIK